MGCLDFTITPVSHKCFLQKVTFRSKDQDTGCSIASDHPFSQTLLLGRGGRHACVRVRNSHVQPRVSLFLPVPIEDHGCTPTPLTPLQPHQASGGSQAGSALCNQSVGQSVNTHGLGTLR